VKGGKAPPVIPILPPHGLPAYRYGLNNTEAAVLKVVGFSELTAENSNQFQKQVCAAWNGHRVVEIDLSRTTVMDCAGLGALITVRNLTHVVRLMNPTSAVQQLLDLVRAGQIFEIIKTPVTPPWLDPLPKGGRGKCPTVNPQIPSLFLSATLIERNGTKE